ncbi:AmmeMemoRadiSam system protein B [Sulfurimonas paralvinellae]|uniref:MEMO1 family protein FM071_04040 n=1 Tax=Sulfurimonas paralvinellae TaxID=317658 RepID=A0A7M1B771_9BACT|nr:AmmeMemoRadiSam system protein B [Sulfurimonas paralvinellae]QOP45495.1 AmmeMemoRadiSam system protein B [Sulfurimonas paralvinellae]
MKALFLLSPFLLFFSLLAGETTRECVVCGSFYPADKTALRIELQNAFSNAPEFSKKDIKALIVPHAGYIFSADVAATAYRTLHRKYKNIFLIGASHYINFDGVSINPKNYETLLGIVQTNHSLVKKLLHKYPKLFHYKKEAHQQEHSLEVQLPFLQFIYKNDFKIIPIILATSNIKTIQQTAKALKPYFNDKDNLFIISSDLSHYPNYKDALVVDQHTLKSITKNSPKLFLDTIKNNAHLGINNLQTSACGWTAITLLLELSKKKHCRYEILQYKNSAQTRGYGDKNRVVGYGAIRMYENETTFTLNDQEKKELKELARLALYEAVLHDKRISVDASKLSPKLSKHLGTFVTLKEQGQLRGCIGRFEPNAPLYEVIIDMAISASRYDNRFSPVTPEELSNIEIEISVLTPRHRVNSVDDIVVGKHGIYVSYGGRNGTYLPQVATDLGWNKEQFFYSCCVEKAGIAPEHCKDAELYVYEAIVF